MMNTVKTRCFYADHQPLLPFCMLIKKKREKKKIRNRAAVLQSTGKCRRGLLYRIRFRKRKGYSIPSTKVGRHLFLSTCGLQFIVHEIRRELLLPRGLFDL